MTTDYSPCMSYRACFLQMCPERNAELSVLAAQKKDRCESITYGYCSLTTAHAIHSTGKTFKYDTFIVQDNNVCVPTITNLS